MSKMINIGKQRGEAEAKLAKLKQARGAALLDGKASNHDEIVQVENLLRQLDDAAGEQARRERAEAEAKRQVRLAKLRKSLGLQEKLPCAGSYATPTHEELFLLCTQGQ